MSQFNTRVVLYGKGTTPANKQLHKTILNQIEPTEVPKEFISTINLVLANDQNLLFAIGSDKGNFCIDEIRDFLSDKGVSEQVARIEVTLDLDAIAEKLTSTTNEFLEKFFSN